MQIEHHPYLTLLVPAFSTSNIPVGGSTFNHPPITFDMEVILNKIY